MRSTNEPWGGGYTARHEPGYGDVFSLEEFFQHYVARFSPIFLPALRALFYAADHYRQAYYQAQAEVERLKTDLQQVPGWLHPDKRRHFDRPDLITDQQMEELFTYKPWQDTRDWRLIKDVEQMLAQTGSSQWGMAWHKLNALAKLARKDRKVLDNAFGYDLPQIFDDWTEADLERYAQLSPPEMYKYMRAAEAELCQLKGETEDDAG